MLSVLASRVILNLRGVLLKTENDGDMANVELTKVDAFASAKRGTTPRSVPATPHRGFPRPPYPDSDLFSDDDGWKEEETNYVPSIKSETI